MSQKKIVVIGLMLVIAALHLFPTGEMFGEHWYVLYYSYFSDAIMPFGFYFLLYFAEENISALKPRPVKAVIIFLVPTFAEILQYFHIYALGSTFDPLDIIMYAAGVGLAVLADIIIFPRIFKV